MRIAAAVIALSVATPALAQSPVVAEAPRFGPAPWWMDQPVIASTGFVETEVQANRANLGASFQAVERTAADATRVATQKVQALGRALGALGADKVRTEVTVSIQPLFEQYRDREGTRIEDQRADRVERYQANANVAIEVRDVTLLQQVYAALVAAQPTSTNPVSFYLEPGNELRTEMFRQAVSDANRRARLATEASGARLGAVKLIDPTGRACQVDVLVTGAPPSYGPGVEVQVVGRQAGFPPPPPPPPPPPLAPAPVVTATGAVGGVMNFITQQDAQALLTSLPVQPPFQKLQSQACVVYALG